MRVNLDWLRDWVDLDGDVEGIAADLTAAGLEVDGIEPAAAPFTDIVVAEVVSVARHPNADRLAVCAVDDGGGQHQVVCGAPNVAPGLRVPFARVGAVLPNGKSIAAAELRGVRSHGMLCSAKELELPDDANGLLILDPDAPVGAPLREYLNLDDSVLEISVTPNRGDCFSVIGIARELAARRGQDLKRSAAGSCTATIDDARAIQLHAGRGCPRFVGRVLRGLDTRAKTPLWMRERLRRAGLRPIQPIVDVTNYVMLELGQPLHAYDLDKLNGAVEARLGVAGESLTLLDGRSVELTDDVLVIADAAGAVGIAGIMGGKTTAVSDKTDAVFLESAFFAPAAINGRARRYGLHTDASLRFERGVDPEGQVRAIERATELLVAISRATVGPLTVAENRADLPQRPAVSLRRPRLRSVLGLEVADDEVEQLLRRLEMRVETETDGWRVTAPSFRFDVSIEEDLIEEVGRMIGYDRIPSTPGHAAEQLGQATEKAVGSDRLVDLLVARGYTEAITYSFVDPELETLVNPGTTHVTLANPIASDMAVLRRSLWPGLINAARLNLSHQRQRLRLFELGPQFIETDGGVQQTTVLAGLCLGSRYPEHWDSPNMGDVDFFDVKGDVEALLQLTGDADEWRFEVAEHPALTPGRTARLTKRGQTVGWVGALHPSLQARVDKKRAAVVFALHVEAIFSSRVPSFRAYSKFPAIRRDLAIVVDEHISAEQLQSVVREAAGGLLQNMVVFDIYRGKGVDSRRKSVGLGLILQDVSRTLTDEDADETMRSVMLRLKHECGATIRT